MTPDEPVHLNEYDADWPRQYRAEARHISDLADGRIVHIEHFGSTAIPGLRAKPTIDVMAAVHDLEDIQAFTARLVQDGYVEYPENFAHRRFFRKEATSATPSIHLHIIKEKDWQHKSERLFRDWLINHPTDSQAYAELKTNLAEAHAADRDTYTQGKSAFCKKVINKARADLGLPPRTDWAE